MFFTGSLLFSFQCIIWYISTVLLREPEASAFTTCLYSNDQFQGSAGRLISTWKKRRLRFFYLWLFRLELFWHLLWHLILKKLGKYHVWNELRLQSQSLAYLGADKKWPLLWNSKYDMMRVWDLQINFWDSPVLTSSCAVVRISINLEAV